MKKKTKNKWFRVTIKATIVKSFDIEAEDEESAIWDAEGTFNPYSGEAEEKYTQEVIEVKKVK
jgi:hypothetical protein